MAQSIIYIPFSNMYLSSNSYQPFPENYLKKHFVRESKIVPHSLPIFNKQIHVPSLKE